MPSRRTFLKTSAQAATALAAAGSGLGAAHAAVAALAPAPVEGSRPNIVLILADDMGYSDIGCFGSEIATPNLDALAAQGMRLSQWYNNPRCCPSRASIMTGLYSHQVGFGMMADDNRYPYPPYSGDLSPQCVTIPEALKTAGYQTAMVGKWHLAAVQNVNPADEKHNWPMQRGFDRYYGTIIGAGSYYNPNYLVRGNERIDTRNDSNFYYTDAIADNGAAFLHEMAQKPDPFFLYAAFTAPHWPLHATEEMIARYKDRYAGGWDKLRDERHARQIQMGLLRAEWAMTPRDPRVPVWDAAIDKDWEARRMAVYAAMIERLDAGIGKLVNEVKAAGKFDDTLFVFMSDNGGNSEELSPVHPPNWRRPNYVPARTRDGSQEVAFGNDPHIMPGAEATYASIGIPWGNCANTPFRLYKHYTNEGGISSPFVACWPKGIKPQKKVSEHHGHETDLMPTFLALSGAVYPSRTKAGPPPPPLVGESLLPLFEGQTRDRKPIFWEHEGNKAVRDGKWKAVTRFSEPWELYDMEADRTELHDLAAAEPDRMLHMIRMWEDWARNVGAQPWPLPETPRGEIMPGVGVPDYLQSTAPSKTLAPVQPVQATIPPHSL
jgi:arylsulfatase